MLPLLQKKYMEISQFIAICFQSYANSNLVSIVQLKGCYGSGLILWPNERPRRYPHNQKAIPHSRDSLLKNGSGKFISYRPYFVQCPQ